MTPNPTLTIDLGAQAGDGESHWLRLEQVRMADEGATMEQAAALIDALYGIEPCSGGMGTGGKEADEENLLEQSEFLEKARELLKLGACEESGGWDAEVDVYRSHQEDGYSLQGERITVGETTPMSRAVTETVELDGASYDLQWPYGGDIVVSGGAVVLDVRGSTVNFSAPVKGLLRIRYTAVWDRVKVRVRPTALGQGDPLAGLHYVAGDNTGKTSREDDSASVVAFWRDLASECRLTRPPLDDQGLEMVEIQRLCNRKTDWHVKGECWQTIETYNICNCSGRESPDVPEREDVDAPCPEGVRPDTFLGTVRNPGEYVDCPGEDRELLNDPDFYRSRCCAEPYPNLPRCRVTREPHRGGAEIENGPECWRDIYGPTVRMIPITPEGGCGEIIRRWDVPMWRDCGDDQDCKSAPHPRLPGLLIIAAGSDFELTVTGGKAPFSWQPRAFLEVIGESADGRTIYLRSIYYIGSTTVSVTDACGREASCRVRTPEDIGLRPGVDDPSDNYCYLVSWHERSRQVMGREYDWVLNPATGYYHAVNHRISSERFSPYSGRWVAISKEEYMSGPGLVVTENDAIDLIPYIDNMRNLDTGQDEKHMVAFVKGNVGIGFGYNRYSEEQWESQKQSWGSDIMGWLERSYNSIVDVVKYLQSLSTYKQQGIEIESAGANSYNEISYYYEDGVRKKISKKYYYYINTYSVYGKTTIPVRC